jgi:hypothetical protein
MPLLEGHRFLCHPIVKRLFRVYGPPVTKCNQTLDLPIREAVLGLVASTPVAVIHHVRRTRAGRHTHKQVACGGVACAFNLHEGQGQGLIYSRAGYLLHALSEPCKWHRGKLAQGISPRTIMETLGHSQVGLTLNTYSHVVPSLQRDAADVMDRLLS